MLRGRFRARLEKYGGCKPFCSETRAAAMSREYSSKTKAKIASIKQTAALLEQRIVDVADSLSVAKGYAVTSMATIASYARVGKQTLYRRYPDKAALFCEVVSRRINRMLFVVGDAHMDDPLAEAKMLGRAALAHVLDPVSASDRHNCWGPSKPKRA
jgi:AcrR family transcriptional regulator